MLDNFDTDYDYSIVVDENGRRKVPKVSNADKELLKLINSDLWCFIKNDEIDKKLNEASQLLDQSQEPQQIDVERLKKIR